MFSGVAGIINRGQKLKGTVVLMQKNVLDINALTAIKSPTGIVTGAFGAIGGAIGTVVDTATSFIGRSVALKLISATSADGSGKGKVGKQTFLEGLLTSILTLGAGQSAYTIHFEWNSDMGIPGAFYIENFMQHEFFLVSLTLEDIPNHGSIHFVCNSWIYNDKKYKSDRIFFANKTYLPNETPAPLVHYRQEELKTLRGDGTGERKEWDRIYDYDVYNDLGAPDQKATLARPVLGGSSILPYPRRGRTGRKPAKKDPNSESRSDFVYLPRDESFGHLKSSDFLAYILKSASQNLIPQLRSIVTLQLKQPEFNTFEDVRSLYEGGIKVPTNFLSDISPIPLFKEIFRSDGAAALKFSKPKVVQVDHSAWMTDEEFAREMIAGVNPHIIKKLVEFPARSKLDTQLYGDNTSTVTKGHLEPNMGGVTVEQAIQNHRLYILDHHDTVFPYLRKINATDTKAYATRTFLFLQNNGTLRPLAIELSKPRPQDDSYGPISEVYLPASEGVEGSIWLLAKAYVVVNDSCYHQLVSHWLNTHAVVEPFIIATNRHLSVVHPVHKLLLPHYRDTMNINSLARNVLVNAEGIIESTFLWGGYSLELSAVVYRDWVFTDQGLPNDLLKRGVAFRFFEWAENQRNYSHSVRAYHLMIESLAKIRQYQIVWDLVNSMRKKGMVNVETFCIIMRKYARAHKVDEAVYTFNVMDKYDTPQNLAAFNGLLSALCKSRNVRKAQEIFDSMKGRFEPDSKTYSILLEGWGKEPNLPKAREVFGEMVSAGCNPDIVTYGIMVDVLCKAGRVDEAVEVVKDMDDNNCRPTSFIYSVLVHTYGVENRIEDAIDTFMEMERNGIKADVVVYNALIGAFCKANKLKNVHRVLREMESNGIAPNSRTCNVIMSSLISQGETDKAFSVFRRMIKLCEPDADTYTMLIKMFCEKNEVDMALKIWRYMKSKQFVPSLHTFSALINGLCQKGNVVKACVLLEEMIEKGIRPSRITFAKLRQLLIKEGREDVLKFLHEKINLLVKEPLYD